MRGRSKAHSDFLIELYKEKDPNAIIGIYKITNRVTGKFYIGSSVDIKKRWKCHLFELKNRLHGNYKIQEEYLIYGISSFFFEIIWESKEKNLHRNALYKIEQEHINKLKPTYNIQLTVSMVKRAKPKKQKFKKSAKKKSHFKKSKGTTVQRIEKALKKLNILPKSGGVRIRRKSDKRKRARSLSS